MVIDLELQRRLATKLSARELIQIILRKLLNRFSIEKSKHDDDRYHWTYEAVIDSIGPEALCRTYLEQSEVRKYLQEISMSRTISVGAEIGSGFGRLTPVLSEFASRTFGFERETSLFKTACLLNTIQTIEYHNVQSLEALPVDDGSTDFVLIFTVLQHIPDQFATNIISEVKRILSPKGALLVVEQTDENDIVGNISDERSLIQRGRSQQKYEELFRPLRLVKTSPRVVERSYSSKSCGTYMLFMKP